MHRRRDAVGGEDDRLALRNLGLLVHEHGPARFEVTDDVQVVDDLLPHVDRRPVQIERPLDRLDGALDACAVAARRRQEDLPHHAASVALNQCQTSCPVSDTSRETEKPAARGVVAAGSP